MAITWADDVDTINVAETAGDWIGVNFAAPALNDTGAATVIFREGSGCMGATAAKQTDGAWYDDIEVDLTGKVLIWWIWFAGPLEISYFSDFLVGLYDATGRGSGSAFGRWNQLPKLQELDRGGWFSAVVWPTQADEKHATLNEPAANAISSISLEGNQADTNFDVKLIGWDFIHAMSYIQASADAVTLDDFAARSDDQDFGAVFKDATAFKSVVDLRLGAAGVTTTWAETSKSLQFANANSDHPLGFDFIDPTTGALHFTCGALSGGNPVTGLVIVWAQPSAAFTNPANCDTFKLYDTTFEGAGVVTLPPGTASREVKGCKFSGCGEIDVDTIVFEDNTVVNATNRGVLMPATGHQMKNNKYINCVNAMRFDTAGTYTIDGDEFFGNTNDIENSSAGLVTINVVSDNPPSSINNSGGGSTVINNNIAVTVTVKDAAGVVIQSAQVSVRKDSDNSELVGGSTDVNGQVTGSVPANQGGVSVRVRKAAGGANDFIPVNSPQTIGAGAFEVTITLLADNINTN